MDLKRAMMEVQAGRLDEARRILAGLLRQNPDNAEAWLWMGQALDDPAKREDCFTRVLRLDPNNDEARLALVALRSGPQEAGSLTEETGRPTHISAHPSDCTQCGSHLRYDISTKGLRCTHCGTQHRFDQVVVAPTWFAVPPDLSIAEAQMEPVGRRSLHCRSCGATTPLSARTASMACPFCGSPQVVQTETATPVVPPHAILPFQIDRHEAEQSLRDWLGQGFWNPEDLAKRAEIIDFHGSYVPFWAFKGLAEVSYRSEFASLAVTGPTSRKNLIPVKDTLLPATYSLDRDIVEDIKPFALEETLPFQPAFLAGWPAEVYQIALADATILAREIMSKEAQVKADAWAPVQEYDAMSDLVSGGISFSGRNWSPTRVRLHRSTSYQAHFWTIHLDSFQHILLPIWFASYRYRGRLYSVAINGQTGEVGGQAPRSRSTISLAVALGVAVMVLLVGLVHRFWPAIHSWMSEAASSEGGTELNPIAVQLVLYGAAILGPLLFGLLSNWSKIRRWLKGGD